MDCVIFAKGGVLYKGSSLCGGSKGDKMNDIKTFLKNHKKEIYIGVAGVIIYTIGFKRGCKASNEAVANLIDKAAAAIDIKCF